MTKRIVTTGDKQPRIIVTSERLPRIDPAVVAAALGAEPGGVPVEGGNHPIAMMARAAEWGKRQEAEAARHDKVVLGEAQLKQLEDLAASLAANGTTPTKARVATAVLNVALRSLTNVSEEQRAALAKELADLAASANGQPPEPNPAETKEP
jgi:hypothetical protein